MPSPEKTSMNQVLGILVHHVRYLLTYGYKNKSQIITVSYFQVTVLNIQLVICVIAS